MSTEFLWCFNVVVVRNTKYSLDLSLWKQFVGFSANRRGLHVEKVRVINFQFSHPKVTASEKVWIFQCHLYSPCFRYLYHRWQDKKLLTLMDRLSNRFTPLCGRVAMMDHTEAFIYRNNNNNFYFYCTVSPNQTRHFTHQCVDRVSTRCLTVIVVAWVCICIIHRRPPVGERRGRGYSVDQFRTFVCMCIRVFIDQ